MSDTPQLTAAQATAILERHWGITAERVVERILGAVDVPKDVAPAAIA